MIIPESVKFECQPECSACCELGSGNVFLSEQEARDIADYLNLSEEVFLESYTGIEKDRYTLKNDSNQNCIFLKPPLCTIYAVRPRQCRTYPFWPENLKNQNRWQITRSECPGIGKGSVYSQKEIKMILKGKTLDSDK